MTINLALGALAGGITTLGEADHQIVTLKTQLRKQKIDLEDLKLEDLGTFLFL